MSGWTMSNTNDLLGGLGALFGLSTYNNPSDAAAPYYDKAISSVDQLVAPYNQRATDVYKPMTQSYLAQLYNPASVVNTIGSTYQASPGYDWQLNQGEQAANNAAAAGGMAGSLQHQQNAANIATNLANQNYWQYVNNALGQYNLGQSGLGSIYNTGANAAQTAANQYGQIYGAQANNAYAGANNSNQSMGGGIASLLGSVGGLLGGFF